MEQRNYSADLDYQHDEAMKEFKSILWMRKKWLTAQDDSSASDWHNELIDRSDKLMSKIQDGYNLIF